MHRELYIINGRSKFIELKYFKSPTVCPFVVLAEYNKTNTSLPVVFVLRSDFVCLVPCKIYYWQENCNIVQSKPLAAP